MTANARHQPPDQSEPGVSDRDEHAPSESESAVTASHGTDTEALAVENLRKAYGSGEDAVTAVDDVSFSVNRGEVVRNLSRGMQQKASLACALARNTPVVFLDEPTLGLDVEAARDLRREIRRLAAEENRTVVLSSHDMDVIQDVCDRVVILNEGRVVADDTVESLVDLFATQRYRVDLAAVPERLDLDGFDVTWPDDCSFEVVLADSDELYSLMRTLETAGAAVQTVTSLEPDFEEVFLSVVEERAAGGTDR